MIIELIPEQNKMYDKKTDALLHLKGKYWCEEITIGTETVYSERCEFSSDYAKKNLLPVFKIGNDYGFVERKYL